MGTCPPIITGPQYGTSFSSTEISDCKAYADSDNLGGDEIIGSFDFHGLTVFLCGALTAVTFIFSGVQVLLHATHFSNPGQQIQYIPTPPP